MKGTFWKRKRIRDKFSQTTAEKLNTIQTLYAFDVSANGRLRFPRRNDTFPAFSRLIFRIEGVYVGVLLREIRFSFRFFRLIKNVRGCVLEIIS